MQFNIPCRAGSARITGGVVWAFLAAVALSAVACSKTADAPGASTAAPGQSVPAPEAASADVPEQGPEVAVVTPAELLDVIRAHQDKVVVVKFWATWCAPCVEEMPKVVAFYEKHRDSTSLAFVSVSADLTDAIHDTVIPFLRKKAVPFPVRVIDAAGPDAIVSGLGLEETAWEGTLPATFLFDKQGRLDRFWIGAVPEGALEEAVTALS